jgi:hypothetical protein
MFGSKQAIFTRDYTVLEGTVDWESEHGKAGNREALAEAFSRNVLPHLKRATVEELHQATGLSRGYLRLVRDGRATPHPRHWAALFAVAGKHAR